MPGARPAEAYRGELIYANKPRERKPIGGDGGGGGGEEGRQAGRQAGGQADRATG